MIKKYSLTICKISLFNNFLACTHNPKFSLTYLPIQICGHSCNHAYFCLTFYTIPYHTTWLQVQFLPLVKSHSCTFKTFLTNCSSYIFLPCILHTKLYCSSLLFRVDLHLIHLQMFLCKRYVFASNV